MFLAPVTWAAANSVGLAHVDHHGLFAVDELDSLGGRQAAACAARPWICGHQQHAARDRQQPRSSTSWLR